MQVGGAHAVAAGTLRVHGRRGSTRGESRLQQRLPTVFIGSSTEGREVAEAFQIELRSDADSSLWSQGFFEPGRSYLEDLAEKTAAYDFGVLVLTPDDARIHRGSSGSVPRDNVVFEAGLFVGVLGRERTFLVRPDDVPDFSMFTDYAGITSILYSFQRFKDRGRAAVGPAANLIKEQLRKWTPKPLDVPTQLGLSADDISDFYRRTGLTYAFGARREAVDRMFADIGHAQRSIRMYARVYLSELFKDTTTLSRAIAQAARAQAQRDGRTEIQITHTSTDAQDEALARRTWSHEDPKQQEWKELQDYQRHLGRSDALFKKLFETLGRELSGTPRSQRAAVRLERRYLVDCVLPYSILAIDDQIVYVSFYEMSPDRFGTFAPTMRLVCHGRPSESWAAAFLAIVEDVDREFSRQGQPSNVL
jgi:predicted nucleotide-binding protein